MNWIEVAIGAATAVVLIVSHAIVYWFGCKEGARAMLKLVREERDRLAQEG